MSGATPFAHIAGIPIEENLSLLPPLLLALSLGVRSARQRLRRAPARTRPARTETGSG